MGQISDGSITPNVCNMSVPNWVDLSILHLSAPLNTIRLQNMELIIIITAFV